MDRKQFLTNVLLVCIGLGLIGYLHYKITKLHNYVDKNNKIVFSLMTEMREEVKRHLNGESLTVLASDEAINAAEVCTTNDINSHKIELSDDSESETDDSSVDESGDSDSESDYIEDVSARDVFGIKEETIVNLTEKERGNQEIKIVNIMNNHGFENMNNIINSIDLGMENFVFYKQKFNNIVDESQINDISDITEIKNDIEDLSEIKNDIEDLSEIKHDVTELVQINEVEINEVEIKHDITELVQINEVEINEVEIKDDSVKLEKTIKDFSQFKVEDLRKMVHSKTGEKKEAIKKMKKTELVNLLSK
jgi:hypothetical protein